jgi:MFS family permease
VLGGDALSAIGSGLTLPFLFVYLHSGCGLETGLAGLAVSALALAGLVGNLAGGILGDRFGPRNALAAGLLCAAAGSVALAAADAIGEAFAAVLVLGVGLGVMWPTQDALLAGVVEPAQRSAVFAVRHTTLNAGLGLGALTAALVVHRASPATFELIYVLDAASFVAFVPILCLVKAVRAEPRQRERGALRTVARDRAFVGVWCLTALLVTAGFAQYHAAFPAYATGHELSASALGVAVAANTLTVVGAQLFALRLMAGRRRSTGLAGVGILFAIAWAVTIAAGELDGPATPLFFALAMVVLALGETLVAPSLPPLVNDLAPDDLRGRYNGAHALAWSTGFVAGPVLSGLALAAGAGALLLVALCALCALAALGAVYLRRHLPSELDRVPA